MITTPAWPPRLTRLDRAVLGLAVFLLTIAVAMWAGTLPGPAPFFVGMGWLYVLGLLAEWESSTDGPTTAAGEPVVLAGREASELGDSLQGLARSAYEDYAARHDLHDAVRFACMFGCADPATCRYPHAGCSHCSSARAGGAGGR